MVTHDPVVAREANTTLHLDKGVLVEAGLPQGVVAGRRIMKFSRLILANLLRKEGAAGSDHRLFAVALFLFALLGVANDAFSRGADVVSAHRLVTIQSHFDHQYDSAFRTGMRSCASRA